MSEQQINHEPIQEGVMHGPYMPSDNPHEQQWLQHAAIDDAYNDGNIDAPARDELHGEVSQLDDTIKEDIQNGDYSKLSQPAKEILESEDAAVDDPDGAQEQADLDAHDAINYPE